MKHACEAAAGPRRIRECAFDFLREVHGRHAEGDADVERAEHAQADGFAVTNAVVGHGFDDVTEGVVVKPLRNGDATLAVGNDGRLALGQWGRDMVDDGSWKSIRQNLILIVDGGKSQVQKGINQGVWWGADYGKQVYVPRSAVCAMPDGRLAYVIVGDVDAFQLADSLINIGCYWLWQIPLAYVLSSTTMGPRGIFLAIVISESTLAVVGMLAFRRGGWKNQKV